MSIGPVGLHIASQATSGVGQMAPIQSAEQASAESPFAKLIDHLVGDANAQQAHADQVVRQLATGQTDNVHDVMLAVAKADLSFRLVLEVRNRLTEAYQEVMRMQV